MRRCCRGSEWDPQNSTRSVAKQSRARRGSGNRRSLRTLRVHRRMRPGADRLVAALAIERGLAAAGGVVEIEGLELVLERRRDREVGIGPAVGRGLDLLEL